MYRSGTWGEERGSGIVYLSTPRRLRLLSLGDGIRTKTAVSSYTGEYCRSGVEPKTLKIHSMVSFLEITLRDQLQEITDSFWQFDTGSDI